MRTSALLIALLTSLAATGYAQVVMEHVEARRANFRPLFSGEVAQLQMDLFRQYGVAGGDTLLFIRIGVEQATRKKVGETWGWTIFDLRPAWHHSSQYIFSQRSGQVVLTRPAFEEVFACANNVFSYVKEADRANDPRFFVVSCAAAGITIGGEFDADNIEGERTSFYWKIGDEEARFQMSERSFGEVIRDFRELIRYWQNEEAAAPGGQ